MAWGGRRVLSVYPAALAAPIYHSPVPSPNRNPHMPAVCRWGILGAANIARKNWKAIRLAENATLTAVASREPSRAKAWLDANQAECPFPTSPAACSYEDLLKRPDVDAVYIPLPTGIRREWVVKAANAGKHILCEKPCGPNAT